MSFCFANKLDVSVSESYNNPYDAYQNINDNKLCLVSDNRVISILDTKMISVKWAVACSKHVLHIFEYKYPDEKRPRKAIEAVYDWIKDPSEKNRWACHNAGSASYRVFNTTIDVYHATYAAFAVYTNNVHYSSIVADYASNAAPNKSSEIKWQRKKLNQIVYEEILVLLVKSQYQRINNKLVRKIPKELLEYIGSFITG